MIEVNSRPILDAVKVCENCYGRSFYAYMADQYLKRNANSERDTVVVDDNPVMWVRVDAIMDAYYSLGIIPDDLYVCFQAKIAALFNRDITTKEFVAYVNSLKIRDFIL